MAALPLCRRFAAVLLGAAAGLAFLLLGAAATVLGVPLFHRCGYWRSFLVPFPSLQAIALYQIDLDKSNFSLQPHQILQWGSVAIVGFGTTDGALGVVSLDKVRLLDALRCWMPCAAGCLPLLDACRCWMPCARRPLLLCRCAAACAALMPTLSSSVGYG